jgi:hypothetical protein
VTTCRQLRESQTPTPEAEALTGGDVGDLEFRWIEEDRALTRCATISKLHTFVRDLRPDLSFI